MFVPRDAGVLLDAGPRDDVRKVFVTANQELIENADLKMILTAVFG